MGKRRQPMDSDAIQRRDPSTSCSWRTRWNICIHKIPHAPTPLPLLCADARLHMECLQMPSLSLYSSLRCFTKIPKQYAWSKSQIGKPASCYHETYLDAWSHDRTGVRLKFLARCNALHWSGYCGCGFSGRIPLHHIFFDCPSFEPARTSRDARLFKIFQSHIHPENSFNWETYISADNHLKLQICLGKRSGNPVLDKKIDTVVRLFLRV